MWFPGIPDSEFFEEMLEPPRDTPWNKWVCGCVLPGLLAIWAVRVLAIQQFWMPFPRFRARYSWHHGSSLFQTISLKGSGCWWAALALLSLAVFFNAHFFWNNHKKLEEYAELVRSIAMIGFAICVVIPVFNALRLVFVL